jgi:crossover junction endodeoxyribonuclease RuvC
VIVIGVDPGTQRTGWGLVRSAGSRIEHVDCGVIVPGARLPLSGKVKLIHDRLAAILRIHAPDAMAVEEVFVAKNSRSALMLGHARGAVLLAGADAGVPIFGYSPTTVKKGITGNGSATKHQVQEMVKLLLKLGEIAQEDAADALALAICHAFHSPAVRG